MYKYIYIYIYIIPTLYSRITILWLIEREGDRERVRERDRQTDRLRVCERVI